MPQVALKQATISYRVLGPRGLTAPPGAVRARHPGRRATLGTRSRKAWPGWDIGAFCRPGRWARTPSRSNQGADLSPRGIAAMINDFIVALDLSEVTLVGNDTGGGLCQFVIDSQPDRIGRLVLTNCDAFDKFPPFPFTAVFALLRGPISIKTLFTMLRLEPRCATPPRLRPAVERSRSRPHRIVDHPMPR